MVKGGMGGMVDNMEGGMSDSKRDIDGLEGSETSLVSKTRPKAKDFVGDAI